MIISFIHAADIHLGSSLDGLLSASKNFDQQRGSASKAFGRLIGVAIEKQVAFMVLAGDTWEHPGLGQIDFIKQIGLLAKENIRVYMILGNHDAEDKIGGLLAALKTYWNVHVFSSEQAETIVATGKGWQVAVHGQSFATTHVTDNLVRDYPKARDGLFNIGLLHTALEGGSVHPHYAPCKLSELKSKHYDYWALGHVHDYHEHASATTGVNGGRVVFSGVLQGRHIRETGAKGAVLVTIDTDAPRVVVSKRLIVDVVRWHKLEVAATGSLEEIAVLIREEIEQVMKKIRSEQREMPVLAVRVVLTTADTVNARDLCELIKQQITYAYTEDEVVLEELMISNLQLRNLQVSSPCGHEPGEIRSLLGEVSRDERFIAEESDRLGKMLNALPRELRQYMGFEPWPRESALMQQSRLLDNLRRISSLKEEPEESVADRNPRINQSVTFLLQAWLPELFPSLIDELMAELEKE